MNTQDVDPTDTEEQELREYHPPQLKRAGTLSDLTQGTGSGIDEGGAGCGAGDAPFC